MKQLVLAVRRTTRVQQGFPMHPTTEQRKAAARQVCLMRNGSRDVMRLLVKANFPIERIER